MTRMTILLSDEMKGKLEEMTEAGGYLNLSDCIRHILRTSLDGFEKAKVLIDEPERKITGMD